jgi:serine/threonine-protein kinase
MLEGRVFADRYRLLAKLGAGGMGSVWRAHDTRLDAEVAIKVIAPEFAGSGEAVARFQREAQAAAAIRSTYVVQILDHGLDGDTPFIAMELLHGESLAKRLARVGRLEPVVAVRLLGHVARALELAHARGIVHRDMKPDNIFLVEEGKEVIGKVLDFGVAKHDSALAPINGLQTPTGMILGSPFYMSPEQANGQRVDSLSDIWAFAVIACECLAGRRPFSGETLATLFYSICIAPLPVPSAIGPVPPGFDHWFARAAARDQAARFRTIGEAADALFEICGAAMSEPPRASSEFVPPYVPTLASVAPRLEATAPASVTSVPPTRASNGGRRWLTLVALTLAGIGAAALYWRTSRPATVSAADSAAPATPEAVTPQQLAATANAATAGAPARNAPKATPPEVIPSTSALAAESAKAVDKPAVNAVRSVSAKSESKTAAVASKDVAAKSAEVRPAGAPVAVKPAPSKPDSSPGANPLHMKME